MSDDREIKENTSTESVSILLEEIEQLKAQNTEVTQIGHDLITAQTKLTSLLHNAADGIITIKPDGTVESFNLAAQTIFGYSEAEVITQQLPHLIPCPDWAENNAAIYLRSFLLGRESEDVPLVGRHKKGHDILLHITSAEIIEESIDLFDDFDESNIVGGDKREEVLVFFIRDITVNKTLEKELKDHKEAIGRSVGIIIRNADFIITDVNSKMLGYLGYTKEQVLSDPALLTPSFPSEQELNIILAEITEKNSWQGEVIYHHKNGEKRYFLLTLTAFKGQDNKIVEYHAIVMDLSDRKKAEQLLAEERSFFSGITDAMADGVYVQDAKGLCTYINPEAARLLGWKADELVGKILHDIIHYKTVAGIPLLPHDCIINHSLQREEAFRTDSEVFWRKDGSAMPVSISAVPSYKEGKFVSATIAFQDISQRKQDEQQLLEQQMALDTTSIVAMTDSKGAITYVNDKFCEISQYSRKELLGKNHSLLSSGHHSKSMWTEMYRTVARGESWHKQVCNQAKDGSLYWVDTTIVAYRDELGKINRYVGIRTDITKQKILEKSLLSLVDEQTKELRAEKERAEQAQRVAEQANHAKSDFLANMSHELRTPMHSILSFSKFGSKQISKIPLEQKSIEKVARFLGNINESGERLMSLLNNLLDLAKLEAGKMDYSFKRQDLRVSIDKILTEFTTKLDEKSIQLSVESQVENTHAYYDYDKIAQVIANVISNAIKFSPESSEIKIVIEDAEDERLLFSIIDQGAGVPENELEAIFDQFIQSSKTDTGAGGTGLGLAICKEIMAAHHGKIWAENNSGSGIVVKFTIAKQSDSKET